MARVEGDPPVLFVSVVEWSELQRIDHACAVLRSAGADEAQARAVWVAAATKLLGVDVVVAIAGKRDVKVMFDRAGVAPPISTGHVIH